MTDDRGGPGDGSKADGPAPAAGDGSRQARTDGGGAGDGSHACPAAGDGSRQARTADGPAPAADSAALEGKSLCHRYRGAARDAVRDVSLRAEPGVVSTVLGPNGSGKSTLLRLLAGGVRPRSGTAEYGGRPLDQWPPRTLARRLAVVTQHEHVPFPVTAGSLAAMGRYPHLGPWRRERAKDRAAVAAAMERCGVAGLEDRDFRTLSGGERQRVRIARALAQEPRVLLLDEPTAALDMRYEMSIFRLLRELATNEGTAVVVVTHNLNLAARFGDRHLLLADGATAAEGSSAEVITGENVSRVYQWPVGVVSQRFQEGDAPQVLPS